MLNFKTCAFVFPGQGSQFIGMLGEFAKKHPSILETFKIASDILNFDCWAVAQSGPQAVLDSTENTQPILLAADIALWRVFQASTSELPAFFAGHSLGEYAALVAAQAITFEDGIRIVAQRGQFMQSAVPEGLGSMAAVLGLENELIEQACREVSEVLNQVVAPANYNSIGQTVIAGHTDAVMQTLDRLKAMGAKRAIRLAVSVPSHCTLMQPAASQLAKVLEGIEIKSPIIPIIHNSDVESHDEPKAIKRVLCEQLYRPVRWVETIQKLSGMTQLVECGPGKVLSGLIKRIDSNLPICHIEDLC